MMLPALHPHLLKRLTVDTTFEAGGNKRGRTEAAGYLRVEGGDYFIADGDILEIRFNL